MKTLFDPEAAKEVVARINNLTPNSTALWGKMKVDQMLALVPGDWKWEQEIRTCPDRLLED